ncbi:Quinone oxidoreductase 1 [Poriferisphaera corsica]|uniref:Quinone oxidoreductase 1 n=1 Tax=Poriferisphaera corsica TaxID=2528020 RepID=A0A517YY45_9BACT|nr:NAD(P)-dependent alcohol dehydrogenase [Poriferisphaera corsica]QDU35127.1 Quinone oxidoreductase 1 [Poriferisphaera corsica]
MRAIVCEKYGPPEVLRVAQVAKPIPGKHQICVKVQATAVTTSDSRIRAFRFPLWHPVGLMIRIVIGIRKPRRPILGLVFSGEIESVGECVTRFQTGDQIYGMTGVNFGTYAEYVCLSERGCSAKKPQEVSHTDAAAVAYGALLAGFFLQKGKIQDRKKVLIYGASGAIGTAAVQLAKHFGADVTGVCSTTNLELVKTLGANSIIDYTKEDSIPSGECFDLVFDAVGKDKSSKLKVACKKALTQSGRYISVDDGVPQSRVENLELVNELLVKGDYKAVIDKHYYFDQIVEAHRYVDTGHKKGNVVITLQKEE